MDIHFRLLFVIASLIGLSSKPNVSSHGSDLIFDYQVTNQVNELIILDRDEFRDIRWKYDLMLLRQFDVELKKNFARR